MRKYIIICFCSISIGLNAQSKVSDYVNPFIGTSNFGATNPGAVYPRGMVSASPFNVSGGGELNAIDKDAQWWSMPYLKENTFFTGFTTVNLSGVGCPDLGAIIFMPTTGKLETAHKSYGSQYTDEVAKAGYYSNVLTKYNIKTEVTASQRAAVHKYTFPKGQSNVLLNLGLGLTNEQDASVQVVSPTEIEGYKMVGAFCYNNPTAVYPVYFYIKLSKPMDNFGVWKKSPEYEGVEAQWMPANGKVRVLENYTKHIAGDSIGVYMSYDTKEGETVELKVGVSYVSIENAKENLEKEVGSKNFNQVYTACINAWEEQLSKVLVEGGTEEDKTIFYTALYHTLIHPNILSDHNGDYNEIGTGKVGNAPHRYTVFSLWDTYRCLHQLFALLYPKQQEDMVKSMLAMYDENGWLPKWELNSTETFTMVGDPASIVIADTYLKGITNFDVNKAYEAMLKGALVYEGYSPTSFPLNTKLEFPSEKNPIRPGLREYIDRGYIAEPAKDIGVWGSVSTTQEYCIADYGIAQMAKLLGKKKDYSYFLKRSQNYRKLYDEEYSLFRPKNRKDGSWYLPFDPMAGANFTHSVGYVETSAYQYAYMVPHDIKGLIKLNGGGKKFVEDLEKFFDNGHYDAANEPVINYPFMFNYVEGEAWRTQRKVKELIREHYTNSPAGIPGNDDTGTMSAWLVFAMMGIYPQNPVSDEYAITTPIFKKVTIKLDNDYYKGKEIVIQSQQEEEGYIQKIILNGKEHKGYFISHKDLTGGGELILEIGERK